MRGQKVLRRCSKQLLLLLCCKRLLLLLRCKHLLLLLLLLRCKQRLAVRIARWDVRAELLGIRWGHLPQRTSRLRAVVADEAWAPKVAPAGFVAGNVPKRHDGYEGGIGCADVASEWCERKLKKLPMHVGILETNNSEGTNNNESKVNRGHYPPSHSEPQYV